MLLRHWGSTPEEISQPVVGDDLCPQARVTATRSITLPAPPHEVFPWLLQMGFGRAGWYSYDILDNLGRRSATKVHPQWQHVQSGDQIPGGPIHFDAVIVHAPTEYVLRVSQLSRKGQRLCFSLAYELRAVPEGTRLVTRMRARVNAPGGRLIEKYVLEPGDGIMLRKQLLNIRKRIVESTKRS